MNIAASRTYNEMAMKIHSRLNGRKYAVGLDLGVGSIGIAIVALEQDSEGVWIPTELVFASSRIFAASAGASERREKRGERNSRRHKSNRLKFLWKVLAERGLMLPVSDVDIPNPAELRFSAETLKLDPYSLRLKGLKEKLSLEELGYALYHIANHRGSSSVRTFLDDEKTKDEQEAIKATESLIAESGINTYIELLFNANTGKFRNTGELSKDRIVPMPTRDAIINELDCLIGTQKGFYPDILDDLYISRIKESVLYENPKLVPDPGNCPYFPDEKKLPRASFINEKRRMLETLNNVRIIHEEIIENGRSITIEEKLTCDEKNELFEHMREGNTLNVSNIKKRFPKYKMFSIVLPGSKKDKTGKQISNPIPGFRFKTLESKPFWSRLTEEQKDTFIFKYVNTADNSKLKKEYIAIGLSEEEAEDAIKTVQLVDGYADIGKTAMTLIMPFIEDGFSYQEAIEMALSAGILPLTEEKVYERLPYYGEAIPTCTKALVGKAWMSEFESKLSTKGFQKPNTAAEEESFGRIANPVVHQTLNELRKIINEMIDILGAKPTRIVVELGRKLKLGKDQREKLDGEYKAKEKNNEKIYSEFCKPNNVGKKYIKSFRFAIEQNWKCPYCLEQFTVSDIVSGKVDIDHILPKEDTADSSEMNLILAHEGCNEKLKEKRIPYEAFGGDGEQWAKIIQNLEETEFLRKKKSYFNMDAEAYSAYLERQPFLNRFKSDNAYVAKIACEYLQCLFDSDQRKVGVKTVRGAETALLRESWNLNGITSSLGELHKLPGQVVSEVERKDRTDFRHHALDAIIAAYSTVSIRNMINTLSGKNVDYETIKKRIPIPKYYKTNRGLSTEKERKEFRDDVEEFIFNSTFVSKKVEVNSNGTLLEDTNYAVVGSSENGVITCVKKKLKDMDVDSFEGKNKSVKNVLTGFKPGYAIDDIEKAKIDKMILHNSNRYEKVISQKDAALSLLERENEEMVLRGEKKRNITEKTVVGRSLKLVGGIYYSLENRDKRKIYLKKEPTENGNGIAYKPGEQYCLDIYRKDDGSFGAECIRKIEAIKKDFRPKYHINGFKLVERLFPKDILEVDLAAYSETAKKGDAARSVHVPNAPGARTFIEIATFTESGTENAQVFFNSIAKKTAQDGSFYISGLKKLHARKIKLSPMGLVIYRSSLIIPE